MGWGALIAPSEWEFSAHLGCFLTLKAGGVINDGYYDNCYYRYSYACAYDYGKGGDGWWGRR